MTIELTNEQIDQIFDGFDWDGYFEDWLTEDTIKNWLNDNPEFVYNYITSLKGYRVSEYLKKEGLNI